ESPPSFMVAEVTELFQQALMRPHRVGTRVVHQGPPGIGHGSGICLRVVRAMGPSLTQKWDLPCRSPAVRPARHPALGGRPASGHRKERNSEIAPEIPRVCSL